jgi:mono/diheme cytochrome c family protein/glucose/arabinose dehydrogenase
MTSKQLIPIALSILAHTLGHADNASKAEAQLEKHPTYQQGYLSKTDSLKSFELPEGYKLELVLSEPQIKEPVAVAWDGNGVMYVAQMRTYMQDADATGEQTPRSRISRHEDTDGDGAYDKHSIYIDDILLPRMILPLDDRLMVGITNTLDLWNYRDTDGDGVADEKVKIYEGGPRGGNMEHQPSGLIWGLDNWIYLTYQAIRYRFTDGKLITEKLSRGEGQWGLTQDDDGRNYYSRAGGEVVSVGFQQPVQYGNLNLPGQFSGEFQKIFPIAQVPDVQGGPRRVGKNGSINHFTGVAGQEVFRGDNLPDDLYGDLLTPEPVGRFIRRAKIQRSGAKTTLANATPGTEFIRTRDVNFRPVQTVTGPDGSLYIVDMHRGIIQQGNWTRKGSYLREVIDRNGLDKNIGHGRIYRLVHKDHQPGKRPQLRDLPTADLVQHLSHRNGWWRDTAKKLIILRKDRQSVAPALEKIALDSQQSEQARITALWTLEGISAITEPLVIQLLSDNNDRILTHAIRVSEPHIKKNSAAIIAKLSKLATTHDPEVAIQLINTINYCGNPSALTATQQTLIKNHGKVEAVIAYRKQRDRKIADKKRHEEAKKKNAILAKSVEKGKATYQQICFACHGADGKGQPLAGQDGHFLAPSFVKAKTVIGTGEPMILSILHGLEGPIDGKTYDGLMPAQHSNSDEWIADVATYIRNSFGNKAPAITKGQVKAMRSKHKDRKQAWTQKELKALFP